MRLTADNQVVQGFGNQVFFHQGAFYRFIKPEIHRLIKTDTVHSLYRAYYLSIWLLSLVD
jgi:hypothetical protein